MNEQTVFDKDILKKGLVGNLADIVLDTRPIKLCGLREVYDPLSLSGVSESWVCYCKTTGCNVIKSFTYKIVKGDNKEFEGEKEE